MAGYVCPFCVLSLTPRSRALFETHSDSLHTSQLGTVLVSTALGCFRSASCGAIRNCPDFALPRFESIDFVSRRPDALYIDVAADIAARLISDLQ